MKDLEQKHLEAISEAYQGVGIFTVKAAYSCALITQRHGEIQRLEGMIEAYENAWNPLTYDELEQLKQELENLKKQ